MPDPRTLGERVEVTEVNIENQSNRAISTTPPLNPRHSLHTSAH
jgi:hypothetical protein